MRINKNNNVENKRTNNEITSDLMNPKIPNLVLKFDFYLILISLNLM